MSQLPVLVFDSGVGGLSIVEAIRHHTPDLPLTYLADSAGLPYGNKSADWLEQRVVALCQQLYSQHPFQMIVVACNTASTQVLPALRRAFKLPVVGVVPAIKPAARISQSKHIGLLATPGTVKRAYTDQLIREFAADCKVERLGTTELVKLAEARLEGTPVSRTELATILEPLFANETLDTIVLGCTHFPLLKAELQQIAPRAIHWVDSGEAIARRVASLSSPSATPADSSQLAFSTAPLPTENLKLRGFQANRLII